MIKQPARSVTRFFIPMLDVMILLFSMFLLLPIAQKAGEYEGVTEEIDSLVKESLELKQENEFQTQQLEQTREETQELLDSLKSLREQKMEELLTTVDRRLLNIDAQTGELLFYAPSQKTILKTREQANELIAKHKKLTGPDKTLIYLFVLPRVESRHPSQGELDKYERWFSEVNTAVVRLKE